VADKKKSALSSVRIIAGEHRSRKITFASGQEGLRPTNDRIRETLFNWLAAYIPSATCLDLFAGSGVLGFEALSRGAGKVVFVDQSPLVNKHLLENSRLLEVDNVEIYCNTAMEWLDSNNQQFDVVFLDPPFDEGFLPALIAKMEKHTVLKEGALIYIEKRRDNKPLDVPARWEELKSKNAGQVSYSLFRYLT